ncbi:outer membrane protein assembly factor BamB family protein [Polaribacter marinivivus]|uniref:PQQ-binding-like beta-propeller repeat protein n=1 Tax=Polaribacter marinivivus TaxID=1524260 RepID=A0ABV8R4T4_9FLAO
MKLKNLQKSILFTFLLFTTIVLNAQKAEAPDNKYEVGAIKWMKMSDAGTLIVSTAKGIYGIKPNESSPSFIFDKRKNIKQENFKLQPNTPYAMFIANGMNGVTFVIDIISGETLFDSKEEGFSFMTSRDIILPENKLVVSGIRKTKGKIGAAYSIAVFDLTNGKEEYTIPQKGNNNVTGVSDIIDGRLLIPRKKGIDAIDLNSGNTIWTADVKNVTSITAEKDAVYAFQSNNNGKNTTIYKINSNGKLVWKDGNKLKGQVRQADYLRQGIAILTDEVVGKNRVSKIYFLDANSGEDLWKKAPKTKGLVSHFYTQDDGIIFGVASGGINKIKFDGTPLWRKPLKTGPNISTLAKTEKGILYITEKDADIVDENTGESIFGKKLKYKQSKSVASTFDAQSKRFLLSCSDGLYSIDGSSGNYEIISKPKFEEKEMPTSIEMRGDNILLSSSQNMMLLDKNGKQIYHEYFKSPSKSGFMKVLSGAIAVTSMAVSASAAYRAGANRNSIGNYNSYGKQMDTYAKGFAQIAGASFGAMSKRFKASAQTKNDKFILTKLNSGVGLIKLDKDSGKKLKEILLKDKKPTYKVDDIERILYYQANKNTIYAYKI